MKKKYLFVLIPFLSLIIYSCSSQSLVKNEIIKEESSWKVTILKLEVGPDTYDKTIGEYIYLKPTDTLGEKIAGALGYKKPVINPSNGSNGFLWLKMTVANQGKVTRKFNFSRIRLIADTYVIDPDIMDFTYHVNPFERNKIIQNIDPGFDFTALLVFEYKKGDLPYKIVYDNLVAGKVYDKIQIPISEK